MKKIILTLCLLLALPIAAVQTAKAADAYDSAAALESAKNDVANWMKYLPDNVFVAHVSIPGTHDAATADGWISSTGPTYSTTQEKNLDYQLANGIRAFDFRPGLKDGHLHCNHGTDETSLTMEDAFNKLTAYLDAHPSEFYVIHLFRGNVPNAGTSLTGGKNSDADREEYNRLCNEFFNQGKFADYIVEYSPYLKVKDIRGKMVIFRRDRINFAYIAKAGNLGDWPSDKNAGGENQIVPVTLASDNTVTGSFYTTDISSPDTKDELDIELTSITNLYNRSTSQDFPNAAKESTGAYKPFWVMCFTSGCYGKMTFNIDTTKGYLANATHTNPHFTSLVRTAQQNGTAGPTGIIFSDWVLTDNHDGYATMGVDLVPAIYENNFYYIENFILDDNLFAEEEVENFWPDGREYFLRNVGTGEFLSSGGDWGTHATINKYGIRITFNYDKDNNAYILKTTQGNGGIGDNYYVDNGSPALFKVKREGAGHFSFSLGENTLTATTHTNQYADGTVYLVDGRPYEAGNPMQQWEVIAVEDYFAQQIADATVNNGVDVSYMVRGHRFLPNDGDNWTGTTNYKKVINTIHASYIAAEGTNEWNDKELMLHCHNTSSSSLYSSNTVWSINHQITDLPAGLYKLSFQAAHYNFNLAESTLTFNINGESVREKLQSVSSNDAAAAVKAIRENPDKYIISLDLNLDETGTITFDMSKTKTNSITGLFLDNITLIYYGPDPTVTCERIQKAIDDATAKINALPAVCQEGWSEDMAPFQAIVDSKDVTGDGTSQVNDIYSLLRQHVYRNLTEGADFTSAIFNNSFEMGDLFGWEITPSDDSKVWDNANATYHVNNCDGNYLYNTWPKGTPLYQTLTSLPAGHYKLQALAVTGDTEDPRYVYLFANDHHSDAIGVNIDKVTFSDIEWEFDVAETGDVIIGILGAKADGSYDEFGDNWYKADNFRLTYMGEPVMDVFYDFLQKAIDMATARVNTLPEQYRTGWDAEMAPYLAIIENQALEGDGTKEADEIYSLMRAHVFAQTEPGADFTAAITNNSFEWGTAYGWTVAEGRGDTGVKPNSNDVYAIDNCDGSYMFNTWDGDNWGSAITQTIPNVPAGNYRLTALLTSDAGKTVYLTANDSRAEVTAAAKTHGEEAVLEFTLTETGDLTIGASSLNAWYKADNFRLTFVSTLEQTIAWTMQGSTFDTLILPFEAEIPAGLEVYTADDLEMGPTGRYHVLVLSPAAAIEACKPYVVKRADAGDAAPAALRAAARAAQTYEFTGVPQQTESDLHTHGALTGTLAGTTVTAGGYAIAHEAEQSYFMTDIDGTTAVEANHAFIANDDNKASLSKIYFETPADDLNTGVDNVIADDAPVSVYSTAGVLLRRDVPAAEALDGLAAGVYIITDGFNVTKTVK